MNSADIVFIRFVALTRTFPSVVSLPGSWSEGCVGGPCGLGERDSALAQRPAGPVQTLPSTSPYRGPIHRGEEAPEGNTSPQHARVRPTGETGFIWG
jgi:hypothetical protein